MIRFPTFSRARIPCTAAARLRNEKEGYRCFTHRATSPTKLESARFRNSSGAFTKLSSGIRQKTIPFRASAGARGISLSSFSQHFKLFKCRPWPAGRGGRPAGPSVRGSRLRPDGPAVLKKMLWFSTFSLARIPCTAAARPRNEKEGDSHLSDKARISSVPQLFRRLHHNIE